MRNNRGKDWLLQAENDLLLAHVALREGFYSQVCFICQQTAEKAIKSVGYHREAKAIFGHSLIKLCEVFQINGELRTAAGVLDQFYLAARYPDALPAGAPCEVFSEQQAQEAINLAKKFIAFAHSNI
jgi:HEPN domain-containing protein